MSDRVFGVLLLIASVAYGLMASGYRVRFGDPLGPTIFPLILAVPTGLLSLVLIFRPDPEPSWVRGAGLNRQLSTLSVLVAYIFLLEPAGFLLSTAVAVLLLALLLGAPPGRALLTGAITSSILYLLFNNLLGLPLPGGVLS